MPQIKFLRGGVGGEGGNGEEGSDGGGGGGGGSGGKFTRVVIQGEHREVEVEARPWSSSSASTIIITVNIVGLVITEPICD